jgi:hypothetical protein
MQTNIHISISRLTIIRIQAISITLRREFIFIFLQKKIMLLVEVYMRTDINRSLRYPHMWLRIAKTTIHKCGCG